MLENLDRGVQSRLDRIFSSAINLGSSCDYFLEATIHPPLVGHLDPISGIRARPFICGLHQPKRMAISAIEGCHSHIFYATNFARWKQHMIDHFRAKGPKFWWMVTSGITCVLDHKNLTNAQRACFELDAHAYCFIMDALSLKIFYRVDCKGTGDLWEAINQLYGHSSTCDDGKVKEDGPKESVHEDVEHDHNLEIVEDCSTSWSSNDVDDGKLHEKEDCIVGDVGVVEPTNEIDIVGDCSIPS